jgi:hypothetical protein
MVCGVSVPLGVSLFFIDVFHRVKPAIEAEKGTMLPGFARDSYSRTRSFIVNHGFNQL